MKKIILAFLLLTTSIFSIDRKTLHFVIGYTINEYGYFHDKPKYKDELRNRMLVLKENNDLKEIEPAIDVILSFDSKKEDIDTTASVRTAIVIIVEHLKGEDQLNFVLGSSVSEIVVLKSLNKPVTDCIDLFKNIATRIKDTDKEMSTVLFEIVSLDAENKLTAKDLLSKLKELMEVYKRNSNLKKI